MIQRGAIATGSNAQTIALIGDNISHSRSPRLHNHLFQLYSLPLHYQLMPVGAHELTVALEAMIEQRYLGANVTSPHKEYTARLMNRLSPEAEATGAVNTIRFEDGMATGFNTDVEGFTSSIRACELLNDPFTVAVLGTGGAAHAAVYGLLRLHRLSSIVYYSRSRERAMAAAARWGDARITGSDHHGFVSATLVINATPVGLGANDGPLLTASELAGTGLLYEMIYSPRRTPLMMVATSCGVPTMNGEKMFLGQALAAFEIWTGISPALGDVPDDLFS